MPRFIKKRSTKIGLPAGSMIHVGEKKVDKVSIDLIDYDIDHFESRPLLTIEDAFPFKETPTVTWLNISGLHEVDILEKIGNHYEIHPLVLEDILNTDQRPKAESYDDYFFIVLKMIRYDDANEKLIIEQVSIVQGNNFVITFQEFAGDVFQPIRERIKEGKGRLRKRSADYLTYALVDVIVDNYYLVLEKFGATIEYLEDSVIGNPNSSLVHDIHKMKSDLIFLRKSIWPLREVIGELIRDENPLIQESTFPYLRDVYDHTIQIVDTVETYRDMVTGILDIYLSGISNKMNEVMKVLTIIATIFIPLTFIAGIYGMNFEFMPELKWRWGYFIVLFVMSMIGVLMFFFFKKKKWF